ncbi:MAG: hypothetical protein N4A46_08930 [Schleiferiaceae bacterium]|jgi:cytochrome c2|nr:hypothetical protein [Schleiferiaceae bacterium]
MKKTAIILFAVVSIAACSQKKIAAGPSAQALAENYSEATIDQLENGKALFEKGCDMCHGLEKSFGVSSEKLVKVVPAMVGKANKKAGQELISETGGENILHYLLAANANK